MYQICSQLIWVTYKTSKTLCYCPVVATTSVVVVVVVVVAETYKCEIAQA